MLNTRSPEPIVSETPPSLGRMLRPLAFDVAVPLGVYYALRYGLHVGLVNALIASSIVPVVRTVASVTQTRTLNGLASLMLAVNVAGIALSYVAGDARIIFAKDSGISSVIAIGILVSVRRGRPLMTAGLEPWVTKGDPARLAAWQRLAIDSSTFAKYERRFSLIWGTALLGECVVRLICAFTVPLPTLSWLAGVLVIGAIGVATVVGGGAAADPMEKLVTAQVARAEAAD
jgi:hypothetical protein